MQYSSRDKSTESDSSNRKKVQQYQISPDEASSDASLLWQPERQLLVGILERAFRDLRIDKHRADAKSWIKCRGREPWQFEWICLTLGISPTYIREHLPKKMHRFPSLRHYSTRSDIGKPKKKKGQRLIQPPTPD